MVSLVGSVIPVILYLFFRCYRYFTDGLSAAYQIETSDKWLVHPNHPLFPLLPQAIQRLGGINSGYPGLDLLCLWAGAFGVLAAWGMLFLLKTARLSSVTALLCLGIFVFSAGVWYFGCTANQYSTALALNILTMIALVGIIRRPDPPTFRDTALVGFLTALAVLAHQVNGLLLIPVAYSFLSGKFPLRRKLANAAWAVVISILIAAVLTIVMGVTLVGLRAPSDFIAWQESYVTQPWYWAQSIPDSLTRTFKGAIELHLAHVFHSEGLFGSWNRSLNSPREYFVWILRIGQAFVLLFLAVETLRALVDYFRSRPKPSLQTLGLTAWLPFAIFCFFFTPDTFNYRVFYMPGYLLFLSPALEKHFSLDSFRFRRAWPVILMVVALFSTNFTAKFLPDHNPDNNALLNEAERLAAILGPGDLMIYSGAGEDYLRADYAHYFVGCDTLILPDAIKRIRMNPEQVIADFERRLSSGGFVGIHEDALYSEEDLDWVNRYYGMNIGRDELADFLDTYSEPTDYCLISDLRIFVIGGEGAFPDNDEARNGSAD
jgi:hypothetical protein